MPKSQSLPLRRPSLAKIATKDNLKLLSSYVRDEVLSIFLQNDTNPIIPYIEYYLTDLLPLLSVCPQLLQDEEIRRTLPDKIE